MNRCNVTQRLIDFANALVGRFRGGLGHVNIIGSMFLPASVGQPFRCRFLRKLEIKMMEDSGYDTEFAAAVPPLQPLNPVIPPSIPAVLLSAVTGISTGLYLPEVSSGVLLGVFECMWWRLSQRNEVTARIIKLHLGNYQERAKALLLCLPLDYLGGIMSGVSPHRGGRYRSSLLHNHFDLCFSRFELESG